MSAVPLSPQVDLGIVMVTEYVLHTQDVAKKLCQRHRCMQSNYARASTCEALGGADDIKHVPLGPRSVVLEHAEALGTNLTRVFAEYKIYKILNDHKTEGEGFAYFAILVAACRKGALAGLRPTSRSQAPHQRVASCCYRTSTAGKPRTSV